MSALGEDDEREEGNEAGRPDDDIASRGTRNLEVVGVRCLESSCATEAPQSSQPHSDERGPDETCRRRRPYWHGLQQPEALLTFEAVFCFVALSA